MYNENNISQTRPIVLHCCVIPLKRENADRYPPRSWPYAMYEKKDRASGMVLMERKCV